MLEVNKFISKFSKIVTTHKYLIFKHILNQIICKSTQCLNMLHHIFHIVTFKYFFDIT